MTDLVFFIHTHKCAGTAFVDLFRQHSFVKMYPRTRRRGGMPDYLRNLKKIRKKSEFEKLYSSQSMDAFVDHTIQSNVNFVATEWVVPPIDFLRHRSGIFLFTVLRDPFERYLSNYYFDIQRGYSKADDLWSYKNASMFRQYDYYTRLFSSHLVSTNAPTTPTHLEQARRTLRSLDAILILENPETFRLLEPLGISLQKLVHRNVTGRKKEYPKEFRDYFARKAISDYLLYRECCSTSQQQLKDLEKCNKRQLVLNRTANVQLLERQSSVSPRLGGVSQPDDRMQRE